MDLVGLDPVKNEHVCHFRQQREAKPFRDPGFWTTSKEEFDFRNLGHQSPEDGQDRRSRLLIFTFVQSIDDNHSRELGFIEGLDNQLHLVIERFVGDVRVRLYQQSEDRSKFGVPACELSSQCWEYELKVSPVLIIPRTEERRPELIACKQPLCDCLRDRALPCSGKPVQPVDGGSVKILCPEFDTVQNGPAILYGVNK